MSCVIGLRLALFRVAALTVTAVVLVSTAAEAQFLLPEGEVAAPLDSPAQGDSEFEDKATGNWRGKRQRLEEAGISIDGKLILEGFKNFRGGLNNSQVWASTFDLSLALDTEKSINWQGGKFYVDLEDHAGQNPSTALVGDLQVFDKLNSAPYLQVFELWYQQRLFDDRLRFKLGKVDANTEFSVIDNGLPFLNSSTQVSPTIFVFPTTPDPMPSVNLFVTPSPSYYASFGAYYANRSEGFGNFVGQPQAAQFSEFGTFLIGETGPRWRQAALFGAGGNLKVGAWGHTGTFTRLDGAQQQGANGYYIVLNQTLWQPAGEPDKGRGLRTFLECGRTQSSVSVIDQHIGGGIAWTGPLAARPDDVTGFSAEYAHLSLQAGLPRSYELALEWLYRLPLSKWAILMPDLQYIVNPGGQYPDALVGTLRLTVHF